MKFPQTIRHRDAKVRLYGPSEGNPTYRIAYRAGGKRILRNFPTYGEAKDEAEKKAREIAKGELVAGLTAAETRDALLCRAIIREHFESTGYRESVPVVLREALTQMRKLDGKSLHEAVSGYLSTVATVKRVPLDEAVEMFLAELEARTKPRAEGERPDLGPKSFYQVAIHLRRFSEMFTGLSVSALSKDYLDLFMGELASMSGKTKNHHRASIRMFLDWSVRKDYLPTNHRLLEASGMQRDRNTNTAPVEFYSPADLRKLLEASEGSMQAAIALQGLAGLRASEVQRLTWEDVFRVPGEIEITAGKAKTRQRRLVTVCAALRQWLKPFTAMKGPLWTAPSRNGAHSVDVDFQEKLAEVCAKAGVKRKRNGLRHAFASFGYALHGETWTSQQAGHDARMLFAHYRGLTQKPEAKKWFDTKPAKDGKIIPLEAQA